MSRKVRADTLPENVSYVGTGCNLAPSCLRCPFPVCRYDGGHPSVVGAKSRAAEAQAMGAEGFPVDEIAASLGRSRRTVYRMLAKERNNEC